MFSRHSKARRLRRSRTAVLAACVATLAALIVTGSASAAQTANTKVVHVSSQEMDLGGFQLQAPLFFPDPFPIVLTNLTIGAKAQWTGDLTAAIGWDTDKVRQGSQLDIGRTLPLVNGNIAVDWHLTGEIDALPIDITVSSDNIDCTPATTGAKFSCKATSDGITLPGALPSPIPTTLIEAQLAITVNFDVTPEGVVSNREFSVGGEDVPGQSANPGPVDLLTDPSSESFTVPCTAKAGDAANYDLGDFHWTPATKATQQIVAQIVNTGPFGVGTAFQYGGDIDLGSADVTNPAFDLTGSGFLTSLGSVLGNNSAPSIAPLGSFSGSEGSPIAFSASVSSKCPVDSYVWDFSNGTKSYGPSPQRAFADNGVYDGQLTITDESGLSTTKSFSVSVGNVNPSVNAGPDTTSDWGQPVQFNGQATDPGSADQPTLQYTWSFGDGSPSATGGPAVTHAYKTPGTYTATLTVCDKDGGCDSDQRVVYVTTRSTTLGYTGPHTAAPSKAVTLAATLVDEYGQPVAGKKIVFTVGSQTATATTDASGKASVSLKITLKQGSYAITATFAAGDAKYAASSDAGTFVVGK